MIRFLGLALLVYCSIVLSNDQVEYLRYVGFEVGHSLAHSHLHSLLKGDKKLSHYNQYINSYLGYKIGKYTAFEFGSFKADSMNTSRNHREGRTKSHGIHMGFVFLLPLSNNLNFLPGIGVTHTSLHLNKKDCFDIKEDGVSPRFMLGTQYAINDNLNIRGALIYNRSAGFYSAPMTITNMIHLGVGLNYSFEAK